MTTVGVKHKVMDRVNAMQMPSYCYHYPHIKRVQLAAVKDGIFHPNLPTLRKMDMDTVRHLLPDEHSRTTTTCGPIDFAHAKRSLFAPPTMQFPSMAITETGRAHHRLYTTPEELKKTREEWSQFLTRCPERFDIRLPEMYDSRDLHFKGYAVRYLRPDLTRGWQFTLQPEPKLHMYAQKPTPANTYSRYRDAHPKYYRNISSDVWR